jgi:predicted small integral membrane protein
MFFLTILALLALMGVWEYARPGGHPRVGVLRFETTRGDRLFVTLLGSAFITLAWLGLVGPGLWWALALSVVYAIGVFRYV